MDGERFDAIVRKLRTEASRRRLLAGLAGGALPAVVGPVAARTKKKKCKGGKKRCGRRCIPKSACCNDADCGGGGSCQNGACACPAGQKDCNGTCVAEASCCGGCGSCEHCAGGACVSTCQTSQRCENNQCCEPLQELCDSVDACCAGATACAVISNGKGGNFGCGFFGASNRCCIDSGADGCGSDCDCCGDALCQDGRCCFPGGQGYICDTLGECCNFKCEPGPINFNICAA
ncbi:MAG TPA: hypothetical protein VFU81_11700 [Thermomicrobiales bacterium]|nr:hypothetical protein [Thermomicrobiales bacterium]